jgi:lambda repressor-like predicted transcriptional regulator
MDNVNLKNCYSANGGLNPRMMYTEFFKELPSLYEMELDHKNQIDCKKITRELAEELFCISGKYTFNTCHYLSMSKTSAVDEDDDGSIYRNGEFVQTSLFIIDHSTSRLWEITRSRVTLLHNHKSVDDFKDLFDNVIKTIPKLKEEIECAEIGLIAYDNGYFTIKSKVNKMDINIEENYNDDFLPVYQDIKSFLNQKGSGLIILNGEKGTGKTSLIKSFASNFPKKYRIVTNAIAQRLAEPEFVSFLLEEKDSIFILEDCEQILMDRSENTFGGAISNILNMSDGLMSDIFNIKFICTFNADITKIDSALLRKGRCYANYEFKPLSVDKVKVLSEKHNLGINVTKPMTLAEIYNYESTDYDSSAKPKKKIGF